MKSSNQYLMKKNIETGNLYIKLKAYDSAIVSFNVVIKDYYDTEFYKEANLQVIRCLSLQGKNDEAQQFLYELELNEKSVVTENFKKQADLINEGTDFFYLDVMCSLEEAEIGINSIKHLDKEFIVGLHYKKDGKLPSGEYFVDVLNALKKYNPLAVTGSCVSIEDTFSMKEDLKNIDIPFGFKINAFKEIPFGWKPDATNPNEVLGKDTDITTEKFFNISQQLIDLGSKIIGGCCEITPAHISKLKKLKC